MKYSVLLLIFLCWLLFSCKKDEHSFIPGNTTSEVVGKTYSANEITAFKQMTVYATNNIIIKLPKRVFIYLVDTTYAPLTNELDSIISELNILLDTNVFINRTRNIANATLKVYLTDRNNYLIAEPQSFASLEGSNYIGLAHLNWDSRGEILNGNAFVDMVINANDFSSQRNTIRHEIMHTLGFYGHVQLAEFNSILKAFRPFPYPTIYTDFDKKMIKLLYNPTIIKGMNEIEFNAVVVNL